jgi:C-terminal peptidase prc
MHRSILVFVALALTWWAAPVGAQEPISCTTVSKNLYVFERLSELYYWYRQLPDLSPLRFRSPEAYLEAVRYRPLDNTFSYITSRAANEALFSNSQFVGFGFTQTSVGNQILVLQVFPGSPAEEVGLVRGARILEINGRSAADLTASRQVDAALGAPEPPETGIVFETPSGQVIRAAMSRRTVTIPTVSHVRVYEVDGRRVGYLFFRNFVEPSRAALYEAFAELAQAGVHDLVLDLRYNGGGLVTVAQQLASLIGGVRTDGQVFAEYFHSDKQVALNHTVRFLAEPGSLGLDRLMVITTRASASASELVINALRPFIPVVIIGGNTYGKPVGQYVMPFCDKVLAPVSFTLRNANRQGDYFDGFRPTCPAPDDVNHELGDVQEASLREALIFAQTGACSRESAGTALRRLPDTGADQPVGWRAVVNAH